MNFVSLKSPIMLVISKFLGEKEKEIMWKWYWIENFSTWAMWEKILSSSLRYEFYSCYLHIVVSNFQVFWAKKKSCENGIGWKNLSPWAMWGQILSSLLRYEFYLCYLRNAVGNVALTCVVAKLVFDTDFWLVSVRNYARKSQCIDD